MGAGDVRELALLGENVDFSLKCSDSVLKCSDFVLKLFSFVLKMLDFAGRHARDRQWHARCVDAVNPLDGLRQSQPTD